MRKTLMSVLVLCGFMTAGFSQTKITEKISVQTYDKTGLVQQLQMEGAEALAFDISTFIEENDHLERVIVNGYMRSDVETKIIKFDSDKSAEGDYLCQEVTTQLKPFLGVKSVGRDDLAGVDVTEIIHASPAFRAGIVTNETITEFNGEAINSYCDLSIAVWASEIGDSAELTVAKGSSVRKAMVTIGEREVYTIKYHYCDEEPAIIKPIANTISEPLVAAQISAYPNPTRSTSQVNFSSSSDEDVIFYVMDIQGNLIHKEVFTNFDERLTASYTFENESDGTYIMMMQQGDEVYKSRVHLIKQ